MEPTLNHKERSTQRRAEEKQQEAALGFNTELGPSQTVIQSGSPQTEPVTETVQQDQSHVNTPPTVQDNGTDRSSVAEASGWSNASREDLLKHINLLETQVYRLQYFNQEQKHQHWEQMRQNHEQLQAKERFIQQLKKERASAFRKEAAKASVSVQEDVQAANTENAFLKGQLLCEQQKVKQLSYMYEEIRKIYVALQQTLSEKHPCQVSNLQPSHSGHEPSTGATESSVRYDPNCMMCLTEQEIAQNAALYKQTQLEKIVQHYKREIETLHEERKESKILLTELLEEKDKYRQQVHDLKSVLHEKELATDAALSRVEELEKEISEISFNSALGRVSQDTLTWSAERDSLLLQLDKQKAALEESNLAKQKAQHDIKQLQKEIFQLQVEREDLKSQVNHLHFSLDEKNVALLNAQSEVKTLKDEKDGLLSSVEDLKTALNKEQEKMEVESSKLTEREQKLNSHQEMLKTKLEKFYAAVQAEKEAKVKKTKEFNQKIERLKVDHTEQLRALQSSESDKRDALVQKILELSNKLKTSQEEQIKETENLSKKKKKGWLAHCFGR